MDSTEKIISVKHLDSLKRSEDQTVLDGVTGAVLLHPDVGALSISGWSLDNKGTTLRLKISQELSTTKYDCARLASRGATIRLSENDRSVDLYAACQKIVETENRLLEAARQKEELERQTQLAQKVEEDQYKKQVAEIALEHRPHIEAMLPSALLSEVKPTDRQIAYQAHRWFGIELPKAPAWFSPYQLDRFLEQTIESWTSTDPWARMKLIRTFCDKGYHAASVALSFDLDKRGHSRELSIAIRTSRMRTLSLCGFCEESDGLGRTLYQEMGELDKYLAFALWGHYRRCPDFDNDGKIRNWLSDYFDEIGEWPNRLDDLDKASELDPGALDRIRQMLVK